MQHRYRLRMKCSIVYEHHRWGQAIIGEQEVWIGSFSIQYNSLDLAQHINLKCWKPGVIAYTLEYLTFLSLPLQIYLFYSIPFVFKLYLLSLFSKIHTIRLFTHILHIIIHSDRKLNDSIQISSLFFLKISKVSVFPLRVFILLPIRKNAPESFAKQFLRLPNSSCSNYLDLSCFSSQSFLNFSWQKFSFVLMPFRESF